MKYTGFTLIEMVLYVALFSFLSFLSVVVYMETQKFFIYTEMYMHRYIANRYIKRVVENAVDYTDPACISFNTDIFCGTDKILDSVYIRRISFLGDITGLKYSKENNILHIIYNIKIGDRNFNEQVKIYLI